MSVADLTKKYEQEKEKLQNEISEALIKEMGPIFDTYPQLENFAWVQYTPYFNDGETCYFGVHADSEWSIYINGDRQDDWTWVDSDRKAKYGSGFEKELVEEEKWKQECAEIISKLIYSVPEEVLEGTYGEGMVVISRDGTSETEDYSHD